MKLVELLTKVENGELNGKKVDNGLLKFEVKNNKIFYEDNDEEISAIRADLDYEIMEDNEKWKPEKGQMYYCINDRGFFLKSLHDADFIDSSRINIGNYFKTKEEAEFKIKQLEILERVKQYTYEFSSEEWKEESVVKYIISYNYYEKELKIGFQSKYKESNIHFKTIEQAQRCLIDIGEEDYKKYVLEVK